jgi:hypothetical protein
MTDGRKRALANGVRRLVLGVLATIGEFERERAHPRAGVRALVRPFPSGLSFWQRERAGRRGFGAETS